MSVSFLHASVRDDFVHMFSSQLAKCIQSASVSLYQDVVVIHERHANCEISDDLSLKLWLRLCSTSSYVISNMASHNAVVFSVLAV